MINTSRGINWGPAAFLIFYQVALLLGLPVYFYYNTPSWAMIAISVVLLYATGMSITAGYHRFFAHRTYKANKVVEAFLILFGTMACQGSVLRWSYDHRLHHAHVDGDDDPYAIKRGFWYAHCLWILEKPREIQQKTVSDLFRNKLVMFQHRHYESLMILTNVLMFLLVGWALNDYLGAFVISFWTRLFVLHHFTWFINSLAHTWGDKPFCTEQTAVDNYIISLLTFGEGYHNYHHAYSNDYRNGIRWYHYDPSKWLIWAFNKLGWTRDLKRMDPYTIKKRMILERKDLLTNRLKDLWYVKKDELENSIQEISEGILEKITEFKQLNDKYREAKGQKDLRSNLKTELKKLKSNIKQDWRMWKQLSSQIMHLKPISV